MPSSNHGRRAFAGLVACALLSVATARADSNLTTRVRDDKSAMANLAIQFAQQVQAQAQANAQALRDLQQQTQKTEAAVASLRRWLIGGLVVITIGLLTAFYYVRDRRLRSAITESVVYASRAGPVSASGLLVHALKLEQHGLFSDALAHYERALALDPALPAAYVGKGRMLNQLGRYQEALVCYDKAAQLQSETPERIARPVGH